MAVAERNVKAVQLLSSFVLQTNEEKEDVDGQNGESNEQDQENQTSRPRNRQSFLKRAHTFSSLRWFAKPSWLSPLECARYGWENVDVNMLRCVSCKTHISGRMPAAHCQKDYDESCKRLSDSLRTGHSQACPWSNSPSPEYFLRLPYDTRTKADRMFAQNFKLLVKVGELLPLLPESFLDTMGLPVCQLQQVLGAYASLCRQVSPGVARSAAVLALTGWSTEHSATSPMRTAMVDCTLCNRKAGMWNFQTIANPEVETLVSEVPENIRCSLAEKYSEAEKGGKESACEGEDSPETSDRVAVSAEESQDTKVSAEESQDTKISAEESQDTKVSAEESQDTKISAEESQDTKVSAEESQDTKVSAEESQDTKVCAEESQETKVSAEDSQDTKVSAENSQDSKVSAEESLDTKVSAKDSLDIKVSTEDTQDTKVSTEDLQDAKVSAEDAKVSTEDLQDTKVPAEDLQDTKGSADESQDKRISNEDLRDTEVSAEESQDTKVSTEDSQDTKVSTEDLRDTKVSAEDSQETKVAETETTETESQAENGNDRSVANMDHGAKEITETEDSQSKVENTEADQSGVVKTEVETEMDTTEAVQEESNKPENPAETGDVLVKTADTETVPTEETKAEDAASEEVQSEMETETTSTENKKRPREDPQENGDQTDAEGKQSCVEVSGGVERMEVGVGETGTTEQAEVREGGQRETSENLQREEDDQKTDEEPPAKRQKSSQPSTPIRRQHIRQTTIFSPLSQHHAWCPWVATGGSSGADAGWRQVLHLLIPQLSPNKSGTIRRRADTSSPEVLRSIRRLFNEWTVPAAAASR